MDEDLERNAAYIARETRQSKFSPIEKLVMIDSGL